MRKPKTTSWKLPENQTEQVLIILRKIYKGWTMCIREVLEYNQEKGIIKCRVRVPKGDYRYTKEPVPYITCIQQQHVLAQISIPFFYFLVRDGLIEIFETEEELKKVEFFIQKLGFFARRELKKIKSEDRRRFLNKRAAEILIDLYLFSDEQQVIKFERKVSSSEEYIVEARFIRRYIGITKLPGLILKMVGEYTREDKEKRIHKTRECLRAKVCHTVYTKIFTNAKA